MLRDRLTLNFELHSLFLSNQIRYRFLAPITISHFTQQEFPVSSRFIHNTDVLSTSTMTHDMVPTSISGLYQNALLENRHRVRATLAPLRSAHLRAVKSVTEVPSIIEHSKKRLVELVRSLSERVYPRTPSTTVVTLPKGSMDVFVSTLGENLNAEHFMRASRESSISHVSIPASSLLLLPPPLTSPIPSLSDPTTAGPGKIVIHCIRHAEVSAPPDAPFLLEANSLTGRTQQIAA
jgi:hypothetical protein